jgi:pSer/pThr/pTyr-binding forkhead associated (FHA) protein
MTSGRIDWDDDSEVTADAPVQRPETTGVKRVSVLRLEAGPGAPQAFALTAERMIVGRAVDADIRIQGNSISRQHMLILRTGPEYTIRDLNSRNGVHLNGIRIHSAVLRSGDQIQVGDSLFIFQSASST